MKTLFRNVAVAALLACGVNGLDARDPTSDTSARRAREVLEIINSGDQSRAEAFTREHFHPALLAQGGTERATEILFSFRDPNSPVEIAELTEQANGVTVRFRRPSTDGTTGIFIRFEPQPPNRITGVGPLGAAGRAPRPQSAPEPAPVTLTPAQKRQAVDSIAALVERNYVTPDTARTIADHLRERARSGAYDALTTPAQLAEALTADLQAVHGDRHLYVRAPGANISSGGRRSAPPAMDLRAETLVGNIGYLKMGFFPSQPAAFDSVAAALRSFGDVDAMILDLRGVPGGSAEMSNFVISHFTPPGIHSLNVVTPAWNDTTRRYTLAEVPGPRRTEIPLYVLVDKGSASAAEDVPFVLQNLGRATLVGEPTAGAGRNNALFPVGYGLVASVSQTHVLDPKTGREWERVGVRPNLAVPSGEALRAAHLAALRSLLEHATDAAEKRDLRRAMEALVRQPTPVG